MGTMRGAPDYTLNQVERMDKFPARTGIAALRPERKEPAILWGRGLAGMRNTP